jgi:4-amino-4-deoxy-L-arabinose transferase-like glycosyltransferase
MSTVANVFERRKLIERAVSMRARLWHLTALAGLLLLALMLNAWGLSKAGYGNTYYAAAVRSMTMSWKNFFFGAFDPGGYITVDKPPAFLWVGALSARIFGYSSWSILLPSAIAGAASVGLLWLIVRRYFGVAAATIAGLVLALSPISVAVDRLNLPEPFLILALIGAAGAVLRSLESRRWWAWTALAGFLVGVAFNTKMLDAWIPGPALALALVVGARAISLASARQLLARLAVLGAVTLVVSASWMLVVDAWPASARPYIGGSTNNTVLDLALGYNGFNRVEGMVSGGGPGPASNTGQAQRPTDGTDGGQAQRPDRQFGQQGGPGAAGGVQPPTGQAAPGGVQPPTGQAAPGGAQAPGGQGAPGRGGSPGGSRGAGGIIAGIPGLLRMFDDANGAQIGWLLPFALGGGLVALWSWRRDPVRRAFAVLFLGWIALYGGIYSYAQGIYHAYYTSTMAPGVAALVGVGAVAVANAVRRDRRWLMVAIALVAVTVWAQLVIAGRTPDFYGWVRPLTVATALAGVAVMVALTVRRLPVASGVMLSVGGLLLLPAAWAWSASTNPSLNATLPQAGPHQGASAQTFGSAAFDAGTPELAAWLKSHNDADATWQLVVSSSQNASTLIAEYQVSVMAIGGFSGTDNTISVAGFADLVSSGAVRYVLVGQGGVAGALGRVVRDFGAGVLRDDGGQRGVLPDGFGGAVLSGPNAVMSAVQSGCTLVSDSSLPSRYQGVLYDCHGAADAIRAAVGN